MRSSRGNSSASGAPLPFRIKVCSRVDPCPLSHSGLHWEGYITFLVSKLLSFKIEVNTRHLQFDRYHVS